MDALSTVLHACTRGPNCVAVPRQKRTKYATVSRTPVAIDAAETRWETTDTFIIITRVKTVINAKIRKIRLLLLHGRVIRYTENTAENRDWNINTISTVRIQDDVGGIAFKFSPAIPILM